MGNINWSWSDLTDKQKQWVTIAICAVATLLGVSLSVATRATIENVKPVVAPAPLTPRPSEAAARIVAKHLDAADAQALSAVAPQLAAVKEFFRAARSRTRAYGELVLSFDSKWKLATDVFRGANHKEHAAWLEAKFAESLFSQQELEQLVSQTVSGLMRQIDDIESQTLVKMQADLEQLPAGSLPLTVDRSALHAKLSDALRAASQAAQTELRAAVGRELCSWITSEVLTVVGVQLATSAGIVGTGAASGWATLGIGVIVGLVVDAIVSEVYRQQFDPVGKIANLLNSNLSEMETILLNGSKTGPGLETRLKDYTARRNAARRQTIQHAILAP